MAMKNGKTLNTLLLSDEDDIISVTHSFNCHSLGDDTKILHSAHLVALERAEEEDRKGDEMRRGEGKANG